MSNQTSIAPWAVKSPGFQIMAERVISGIAARKSAPLVSFANGSDLTPTQGTLGNAYAQSVWIYSCISTLAETISGIPFRILTGAEGSEKVVTAGPAVDLFTRPHPQMDRFQFKELLVSWLGLRGEFFIIGTTADNQVLPLSKRVKIQRLHVLSPDRFREIVADNQLEGWQFTASSFDGTLPSWALLPDEVIHCKLPNPFYTWRGFSPLIVATLAAQTDFAAAQFIKGIMANNGAQGLIVSTDNTLQDEQRDQVLAALRERKRAAGTADRPLILEAGLKVEKPELSSADSQVLDGRKFNRQEICAIYKTPQEVLGFSEDANRAIADAVRLSFMENRIAPLCSRIEAALEPVVQCVQPGTQGKFHVNGTPIMQAAQRSRIETARKAWEMGYSANEVNQAYSLGLPKFAEGDRRYLPYALQELGAPDQRQSTDTGQDPAAGTSTDTNSKKGELERALDFIRGTAKIEARNPKPAPKRACRGSQEYEASIAGAVKLMKGKANKFFFEQRARILKKLAELHPAKGIIKSVDGWFDLPTENDALGKALKPAFVADLEFGGAQLFKEYGLGDFKLKPEAAIKFLSKKEGMVQAVNIFTRDSLATTLNAGLADGESFQKLSDRVKKFFNDSSDYRADRIALTETNSAVNGGRHEAVVESGLKKAWLTSHLENTRESHLRCEEESADGIDADEIFSNGCAFPGDPNGAAEEVINCRCHLIAKSNGAKIINLGGPLLHFTEWYATKGSYALAA